MRCRRTRTGCGRGALRVLWRRREGFDVVLQGAVSPLPAGTGAVASATSVSPAECLVSGWTHEHMINKCLVKNEGSVSSEADSSWACGGAASVSYKDLRRGCRELRGVRVSHLVRKRSPHKGKRLDKAMLQAGNRTGSGNGVGESQITAYLLFPRHPMGATSFTRWSPQWIPWMPLERSLSVLQTCGRYVPIHNSTHQSRVLGQADPRGLNTWCFLFLMVPKPPKAGRVTYWLALLQTCPRGFSP